MKAAPADQIRLLDVQAVDLALAQMAHRRRTLPEHAEIEKTTAELAHLREELVAAESVVTGLDERIAGLEREVEQVRARSDRDSQRMTSGAVGSSKELEKLQHEVDTLAAKQSDLEDEELRVMEEREEADTARAEAQARVEAAAEALAAAELRRDTLETEIDAEIAARRADRDPLAAAIPADLMALYEKIRAGNAGIGAAALRARRCGGCRLELTSTDLSAAREAAADEVLRCEECRRILVRTPESGL